MLTTQYIKDSNVRNKPKETRWYELSIAQSLLWTGQRIRSNKRITKRSCDKFELHKQTF